MQTVRRPAYSKLNTMRSSLVALLTLICVFTAICPQPSICAEERPVNFIFLVDVSGSMVMKSTMVTAANGSQVTLFEALRDALKQIVNDRRLIGAKSRVSFITFGTQITEKSTWPEQVQADSDRETLIARITDVTELQADKHGDTYMGGALNAALTKANQLYSQQDPCTTTFIIMLTDGWDEPPKGAQHQVKAVAAQIVAKEKQIQSKLGVNTWQVAVVGLQRLPDRKAGTTTAAELAKLLGGTFLDVSKEGGGSVSERIFLSLKRTVESLKGDIKYVGTPSDGTDPFSERKDEFDRERAKRGLAMGVLDFGSVDGNGNAIATMPLEVRSCYGEEITSLSESSATTDVSKLKALISKVSPAFGIKEPIRLASSLTPGAITVSLSVTPCILSPKESKEGARGTALQNVDLNLTAHSTCPAGHYIGSIKMASTARMQDTISYFVTVPGRLISGNDEMKVRAKKTGFFFAEGTETEIKTTLKELPGSHSKAIYTVEIAADAPVMHSEKHKKDSAPIILDAENINSGKPLTMVLDTTKTESQEFVLPVSIPAKQEPGKYKGKLKIKVSGPTQLAAPSEVDYELFIEPSPWEEVAPIAVPILIVLLICLIFGMILMVASMKRN